MAVAVLPTVTYGNRMVLHIGEQEVQLIAVPRAHTDGDTMVWFPGLDAVMTGDFYRAVGYPNVDLRNGGSLQGLIDGLGQVIGRAMRAIAVGEHVHVHNIESGRGRGDKAGA